MRLHTFLPALAITILAPALGQTAGAADAPSVKLVPPQIVSEPFPVFPPSARRDGKEAWVHLRFAVGKDGTTSNVRVVDGFYDDDFSAAAIKSVEQAKYKPGTVNGAPADWTNVDYNLEFSLLFGKPKAELGASYDFKRKYKKVDKLIAAGKFADVKTMIESMFADNDVVLLYDYAVAQIALSQAENQLGHPEAALTAIRRATPYNPMPMSATPAKAPAPPARGKPPAFPIMLDFLPQKLLTVALKDRLFLDLKTGRYPDAIETYKRLSFVSGGKVNPTLTKQVDQVSKLIASGDPLPLKATLENQPWSYQMAHHDFTITGLKGSVSGLTLRCDRKDSTIKFQQDVEWVLPPAWGNCNLTVKGTPGTKFTLVEFAKPAPKAGSKAN